MMKKVAVFVSILGMLSLSGQSQSFFVLNPERYKQYIDQFNADDDELYKQHIPNDSAWQFIQSNVPFLDCPDKNLELTYYFRWWTFRKQIKATPEGFVFTEFLPPVAWAGKYNSISCAAAHHFYEGRWLRDTKFLHDYSLFWLRKGGDPRSYSFWISDALWSFHQVKPNPELLTDLLPDLITNYKAWEKGRLYQDKFFIGKNPDGLFTTIDDRDGMEMSIGQHGKRPTINSYMYGDARAIARIGLLKGDKLVAKQFTLKADTLRSLVLTKLWDKENNFFKTMPYNQSKLVDVRELLGYTPWYFNLPPQGKGYEQAWRQLQSNQGFYAPYGLTTAEQSHPKFEVSYAGHECKWNGPSWPFATAVTLTAMANLLNDYKQMVITPRDYFDQLTIYSNAHRRVTASGRVLPWIDEVLNPYTGDWMSRTMLEAAGWKESKGGRERGKDYNHSTFCDLVISGLIGLRPQDDNTIVINPLVPAGEWDWFCLDNIAYHGKMLTVLFDRYGTKYNKGKGLMCFANGKLLAKADSIQNLNVSLE